ncbi:MAG: restriction endonuclease [Acidimicrobiia bacterium]|nr:restriction endonuclease [Acidimicrobiia bacterium]
MAVPTYDLMMRPLLELATQQDITRRIAQQAMRQHFHLTDEEMTLRVPSGTSSVVANRAGWAMTYLTKAGLIEKIAPKTYRATPAGISYLPQHAGDITNSDLLRLDSFRDFVDAYTRNRSEAEDKKRQSHAAMTTLTPTETIDGALQTLHADVRQRLLAAILAQDPEFFERLVLDVLGRMGYGDIHGQGRLHTGKSGDEGIDGRINVDSLGLDQVLVQAKRFAPEQVVPRKDIQAFIGSLAGQGVTKGVFITTSSFASSAQEFVQRGSQTKVVLIDGHALIDLMMRYKVGVRVERTVEVLDIDQNYFSKE